jgi:hypothetical protein
MEDKLEYFQFAHLPSHLQDISKPFSELANLMADVTPTCPQQTIGLQKLLEAKDCFVRAALKGTNR